MYNAMKKLAVLVILSLLCSLVAFSQRGPGGVTDDSNNQKNCRVWLDAGDLDNLVDGDPVYSWYDKSVSIENDSAFWDENDQDLYLAPLYRSSPAYSINGKPVISFESGGMLSIGQWDGNNSVPPSPDLNSNPGVLTTYEQTIFIAFRTSNDVTTKQILWEEGGSDRGFLIYIYNNYVRIGAYDDRVDNNDPGSPNVPAFGFTYRQTIVQPNTTYVLSMVYDVPTSAHNNVLITNSTNPAPTLYSGLTGTLNGQTFPSSLITGCCQASGVGGVFTHPDPIGIGGLNRTSYDETGDIELNQNATGTRLFTGRIAEICYYAYAMNSAERIIVENYLAAKYFANVIANDKYEHQASYGDGVIGIGRQSAGIEHNISQGDNLFEIKVSNLATAFSSPPQYLLVGHNNSAISWTSQNTPDSASVQRLRRIWRWDRSGTNPTNKNVILTLAPSDMAKLPALPSGFTKYGVMIDDVSPNLPNFSSANSQVIELTNNGSGTYSANVVIEDDAFLTLVAIKPTVQFDLFADYTIEGNPPPSSITKNILIKLNYKPSASSSFSVGLNFVDIAAVEGNDYNEATNNPVAFPPGNNITYAQFDVLPNTVEDGPVKDFYIIINPATTSSGLTVGAKDTLIYSIYDDDSDPYISFASAASTVNETDGVVNINLQVIGETTAPTPVRVRRLQTSIAGTATYNTDYTLPTSPYGWFNTGGYRAKNVSIPAGINQTATVSFPIIDDLTNEYNETIKFDLVPTTGGTGTAVVDDASILAHTMTIADNDPEPTVSFSSGSSEGYESVSDPRIYVELSNPSEKEIQVPYTITGGTATNDAVASGGDYAADPLGGTIIFLPGETEKYVYYDQASDNSDIVVYADNNTEEGDETILFELGTPVNAGLGLTTTHTYTIKEYADFQWQGVAGVGQASDNTFWMVPDATSSGSGASAIPNLSPRPVEVFQTTSANQPTVTNATSGVNKHQMVDFDGSNDFLIVGSTGSLEGTFPLINSGGLYDKKSMFFVIRPHNVGSSTPQVIYEQGGGTRGISVYIYSGSLYFYVWNDNNDGPHSPWGLGVAYCRYTGIQNNQTYIVSCHYGRNWNTDGSPFTVPTISGLSLYVNGNLADSYSGNVGRLYTHTGKAALGAAYHQTRFQHTNTVPASSSTSKSNFYNGEIGEFLYLNEPEMNEARIQIIHNYFSAKYDIPLIAGQSFDLDYADELTNTLPDYNKDAAGIGSINGNTHVDAQGSSEMRVQASSFAATPAVLMWGHNGVALTETYPYANEPLPTGINERSGRIWRFNSITGSVNPITIFIKYSASGNADEFIDHPEYLKLLVNRSGNPDDFSTAQVINNTQGSNDGAVAKFVGVNVSDGMYLALGNTSNYFNTPLPIELLEFDAELKGSVVNLSWVTATEENNDRFIVERAGADLIWEDLLSVAGAGNSTATLYYHEKDLNPLKGVSYYRLSQVDFDGKTTKSDIVSVFNPGNNLDNQLSVYPNPSKGGSIFIRVPDKISSLYGQIRVLNVSGSVVFQKDFDEFNAIEELSLGNLPTGVYVVQMITESSSQTTKLVLE